MVATKLGKNVQLFKDNYLEHLLAMLFSNALTKWKIYTITETSMTALQNWT